MLKIRLNKLGIPFYIPPKKHPDRLIQDYLHSSGEFSAQASIAFERRLNKNYEFRGYERRKSFVWE